MQSILDTLRREHLPPVYGFINAVHTQDDPATTMQVLQAWRAAGNSLGNHTWSHPSLEASTTAQFETEITRNEPTLRQCAGQTDWPWFRFPFLQEGETLEKRRAVQAFLTPTATASPRSHWTLKTRSTTLPMRAALTRGRPRASPRCTTAIWPWLADQYTNLFRSLSRTLYGREIPYVLLLHVGAATARFLPDLLAQLRARGFTFIPLEEASSDPAYSIDPGIGYPGGGSLQELQAAAHRTPVPPNAKPNAQLESFCLK